MKNIRKIAMPMYIWINILHWSVCCTMFGLASVYLLDKGFTTSQFGLILASAYALSTVLQPAVASMFQKFNLRTNTGLAGMYLIEALIVLAQLAVPMGKGVLAVLFAVALSLQFTAMPVISALAQDFNSSGIPINFGLARGIGSASFSLTSALMAVVLRTVAPSILPAIYLVALVLLVVSLIVLRAPCLPNEKEVEAEAKQSGGSFLRKYPRFVLFLLGSVLLLIPYQFIENFMLKLMQNVNGTSSHQSVALAIVSIVELPTMMLYSQLSRKFGYKRLLTVAGWAIMLKTLLALLATGPAGLYAAESMQIFGMAIYTPAVLEYGAKNLAPRDFMKGQALIGSTNVLGGLIATSLGGVMIDMFGVTPMMMILLVVVIVGAVLLTMSMPWKKKRADA